MENFRGEIVRIQAGLSLLKASALTFLLVAAACTNQIQPTGPEQEKVSEAPAAPSETPVDTRVTRSSPAPEPTPEVKKEQRSLPAATVRISRRYRFVKTWPEPESKAQPIALLKGGAQVEKLEEKSGWVRVRYFDNGVPKKGWIRKEVCEGHERQRKTEEKKGADRRPVKKELSPI